MQLTSRVNIVHLQVFLGLECSASNRIIHGKDHASIQINIADVDEATGSMTGTYKSDAAISRLAIQDGIMKM
ncbi:RPS21 [Cordylochernes scorpioides]|uniref:RPS21 n=1 Tax=Cordylochernes scorpioides TaxID=51811 RepID=A0ABY6LTG6_9ARAC|nr:RPS21 [Cordylochernes scorpioides]